MTIDLEKAVHYLKQGQVVAFPTETVYGLGANALDSKAITRIYEAKGRPSDNPLIVHVSSLEMLYSILKDPSDLDIYLPIIKEYWPGPLTILLSKSDKIPLNVTGGHTTVAVRMPNHPIALQLIESCGFPLAAPSANLSGRPSPTCFEHVQKDLGQFIPLIIDGGSCSFGIESTVLDGLQNPPTILRPGSITMEELKTFPGMEKLIVYKKGLKDQIGMMDAPTTPGMKYKHYTPDAMVILFESCSSKERQRTLVEKYKGKYQGKRIGTLRSEVESNQPLDVFLGRTQSVIASNLYRTLLHFENKVDIILVEGIKEDGIGLGIMNRLRKAASIIVSEDE